MRKSPIAAVHPTAIAAVYLRVQAEAGVACPNQSLIATAHASTIVLEPSKPIVCDPPPRAVLGCIQIATDLVLDSEGPKLIERLPGVELRLQKLAMPGQGIDAETFARCEESIRTAAATLLPSDRCTVVGLACTSMSFSLGAAKVDAQLQLACPGGRTTDMARAQAASAQTLARCRWQRPPTPGR